MDRVEKFMKDESGLSTLEYIIGAGVMAGLALAVFVGLKDEINTAGGSVEGAISTAGDSSSSVVTDAKDGQLDN